ncbi:MAG: hypothetical protein AAF363_08500 [Bacteroidota bacterium]
MVVDTSHHVISHIGASYADLKDNQYLQDVVRKLKPRLKTQGLYWENLLADTSYSSGENYAFLEREKLTGCIPAHGTYKGGAESFKYDQDNDHWICPEGKIARYRKLQIERELQS